MPFYTCRQVSLTPVGLVRCVAIGPSGYWAAVGQSSGFLTILDIRTGLVIASWKGHEGEVLFGYTFMMMIEALKLTV